MNKIIQTGCFLLVIGINRSANAQKISQLRFKLGSSFQLNFPSNSTKGYAYQKSGGEVGPTLGLEYFHKNDQANYGWFAGVSLDIQQFSGEFNKKNIDQTPSPISRSVYIGTGSWRFYFGAEKQIGKTDIPLKKNYFSIDGGVGLNINPYGGNGWQVGTSGDFATTKDGKTLKSPYVDFNIPWSPGPSYWFLVTMRRSFIFSPTLFAGLRWHIRNKKGHEALLAELMANYGLTRYYSYYIPYTLDGEPHTDKLAEKGVCVQLNFYIPLKNFGKRKNKK